MRKVVDPCQGKNKENKSIQERKEETWTYWVCLNMKDIEWKADLRSQRVVHTTASCICAWLSECEK